jgi:hypothetical protein
MSPHLWHVGNRQIRLTCFRTQPRVNAAPVQGDVNSSTVITRAAEEALRKLQGQQTEEGRPLPLSAPKAPFRASCRLSSREQDDCTRVPLRSG